MPTKKKSKPAKAIQKPVMNNYQQALSDIKQLVQQARYASARSVNAIMTATYWESGKALTFVTLGRPDLLKDKLWGFCDLREQDRSVILALKPSCNELLETAKWEKGQEAHPSWPDHVDSRVKELFKDLGYESH